MSQIDIESEEDSNDLPPRLAANEGQEPTRLRGQDERDGNSRMGRNKEELPWKCLPVSLVLAYKSFGVVYGDLSTSPLYVYSNIFAGMSQHHQNYDTTFGAFSLIFWTLTLIPLLKYVIIILTADDNGKGGTFALYSRLCRHGKFSLLPNQQAADEELSAYKYGPLGQSSSALTLKRSLEKRKNLRTALLLIVLLGAGMVIGDGVVTPAVSAVSGLKAAHRRLPEGVVRLTCCVILVGLFAMQHSGTHKVLKQCLQIWVISLQPQ